MPAARCLLVCDLDGRDSALSLEPAVLGFNFGSKKIVHVGLQI
jgi:hypothetical protein